MKKTTPISSPESSSSSLTSNESFSSSSSSTTTTLLSPLSRIKYMISSSSSSFTTKTKTTKPYSLSMQSSTISTLSKLKPKSLNLYPSISNMSQILGIKNDNNKMENALISGKRVNFAINFYLRDYYSNYPDIITSLSTKLNQTSLNDSLMNKDKDNIKPSILHENVLQEKVNENEEVVEEEENPNKQLFPYEIIEYIAHFLDFQNIILWSSINNTHRTCCLESQELWGKYLLESKYVSEYIDEINNNNNSDDYNYIQMKNGKILNEYDILKAEEEDGGMLAVIKMEEHLDKAIIKSLYNNNNDKNRYLFKLYLLCKYLDDSKYCLKCWKRNSIVPLLYGFPSEALMIHHKNRSIYLNGDYIFDNSPIFCCLNCREEYMCSPHHVCTLQIIPDDLLYVQF